MTDDKLVTVKIRSGMQIQVKMPDQLQPVDISAPADKPPKEVQIPASQVKNWLHALEAIPELKPAK